MLNQATSASARASVLGFAAEGLDVGPARGAFGLPVRAASSSGLLLRSVNGAGLDGNFASGASSETGSGFA